VYLAINLTPLIGALERADGMEGALVLPALEEALSGNAMIERIEAGYVLALGSTWP